ncbi:MAG: hypothetical protein U9Q35_01055 [Pseudomonadota bacterium]|nr:hypothetical protein [Pseudomonadota bacterium]
MSKRKSKPPVYLRAARLVDPRTGAEVSAFVPAGHADQSEIQRKGVKIGGYVRASLSKPRDIVNHRRAHVLGSLVIENIDGFEECDYHAALKRLQRESGVFCEQMEVEVPGVGTLGVNVPKSMAFDEMDETEFDEMVRGLCRHIATRYWPTLTPEQVEEMTRVMPGEAA